MPHCVCVCVCVASKHILSCFGGAGGQHACAIARLLGMEKVFVHRFAGILSAYGLALADLVQDVQEPLALELAPCNDNEIQSRLAQLAKQASDALRKRGFDDSAIEIVEYLNIKYQGTDTTLMISKYDAQRVVHTYDCIAWSVTID
jgi:5-oxoprolinase (ATP-hydrolysing)